MSHFGDRRTGGNVVKLAGRSRPVVGALVVMSSIMAVGCSSHREPLLEGTTWQLVSIQSMDDAQGTTPVPDPSKFMVTFDKERAGVLPARLQPRQGLLQDGDQR